MSHIVYYIPEMENIYIKPSVVYKSGKNKNKYLMDICYPKNASSNSRYPAVILINGGCGAPLVLHPKIKSFFESWGRLIAASGLVAINFVWRYKNPEDIADLITHVSNNAKELNIDENRLCIFVFSRGVSIGLEQVFSLNKKSIRCLVAYYGKLPTAPLNNSELYIPPTLIAMAGKDKFFSISCNDDFISQARSKEVDVVFLSHISGEHAFDMRNDDEQSQYIIKQTIVFINTYMRDLSK